MMSKGYICVVQNNEETDYLRLAYALALSIKNTQSGVNKLSIVTDIKVKDMPKRCRKAFDKVIPIKKDKAADSDWKLDNIVDLYDYTPYDETVMLDSDMVFLTDVSHWWKYLSLKNVWFTTHARNFKSEPVPHNTIYREEFVYNQIPSVYNAFFYFKKSEDSKALFDMMKKVHKSWDQCVDKFLFRRRPKVFSTDLAFGLSIKLLDMENATTFPDISFPYFTHMKMQNQNWVLLDRHFDGDWSQCVDVSFDKFNDSLGLKIASVRQLGVFHYHIKEFITDDMIRILEKPNA